MLSILISLFVTQAFAATPPAFRDTDLEVLRSKKENIVIYTWSPNMNLSQRGVTEFLKWAEDNHVRSLVLLDPLANMKTAQELAKKNSWAESTLKINDSSQLIKIGIRTHYPSYVFIKKGAPKMRLVPGYKSRTELMSLKRHFLQ